MNLIFFAAWVAAGAVLILPLGLLSRAGRRLLGRGGANLRSTVSAGANSAQGETKASPNAVSLEAEEANLTAAVAPERAVTQPARRRTQRLASVLSFLLYVAFIAGAIYYIPQILSRVLDTPHPMASVSSQSMWPALKKGDLVFLRGVDKPEDLEIGDIIAFRHEKGITVHRVLEIDGDIITTQGDANPVPDQPIRFDQVVGRVLTIDGRLIRVPQVGSIAGLFGPLASNAGQTPEDQRQSTDESTQSLAVPGADEPPQEQTNPGPQGVQSDEGPGRASPGTTELVSVDSAGNQANGFSNWLAIGADGRFVAFASEASNLVSGDTNGQSDVFVHDRQTGATERVSVDSAGNQADGSSEASAITGDGRFVAFESAANNLVSGDTNGRGDVFVHDRQTGVTERASVNGAGNQADGGSDAPAISGDGRFVAFESMATNLVSRDSNRDQDIFVHDRRTGATERVSVSSDGKQASSPSDVPSISADGRLVAFVSGANNLVPGDTNRFYFADVFVHDRHTGATERVSVNSAGNQGNDYSGLPAISADGRFVAFLSLAGDLSPVTGYGQHVFVRDRGAADANGP